MPRYIAILFALPLLLSRNENNEFELSTREVIFSMKQELIHTSIGKRVEDNYTSVTKTPTNVFAEHKLYIHPYSSRSKLPDLRVDIDIVEWQSFIKSLSELRINEWKNVYHLDELNDDFDGSGTCWRLEIVSQNADKSNIFSGCNAYPPNWDEFIKVMTDFEAKIKSKAGAK